MDYTDPHRTRYPKASSAWYGAYARANPTYPQLAQRSAATASGSASTGSGTKEGKGHEPVVDSFAAGEEAVVGAKGSWQSYLDGAFSAMGGAYVGWIGVAE